MIRVVLVDDEKWSLYGLMHLIDWEKYGCEIAATASDGREALRICREKKPDMLITDICMPDISGLELAQTILSEQKNTAVVFITGHEEIRYAQSAVRLGAFDYLLKPIASEDLTELIGKFRQHRLSQKQQPSDSVFFTLFDESNTDSIEKSMEKVNIQTGPEKHVRALTLQYAKETAVPGNAWKACRMGRIALFRTGRFQLSAFLFTDTPFLPSDRNMQDAEQEIGAGEAEHSGISTDFDPSGSFREAYVQSCTAADTASFWKNKWAEYCSEPDLSRTQTEFRKLKGILKTGENSRACMKAWLDTLHGMQLDVLEKQINEGLWHVCRYLEGTGAAEGDSKLFLDEFENFTQIEDYFLNLDDRHREEPGRADQSVQKVLEYIDEHYTEKITLSMIARKFYINPCYLSTLIHERTGRTYSEIITGKRMELVTALLENTQLPVIDIAEKAGYNVYSHFLNLFKREIGLSPSAWRSMHSGEHSP